MINTRSDGMVIDVLNVADGQTGKGPILDRYHQIEETLTAVWNGEVDVETVLQKQRELNLPPHRQRRYIQPRIRIDNDASDRATIIDIRVHDQVGLLYTISDAFYKLGLDIRLAKITTEAFIAEDSFYVTDTNGAKITDSTRLKKIQEALAQLEIFKPPSGNGS
jgi:[protein-PII] uridylyltransferase